MFTIGRDEAFATDVDGSSHKGLTGADFMSPFGLLGLVASSAGEADWLSLAAGSSLRTGEGCSTIDFGFTGTADVDVDAKMLRGSGRDEGDAEVEALEGGMPCTFLTLSA